MASDDDDIEHIIAGHRRYRQTRKQDREFYESLASRQQRPRMLWIGCADSRVIPTQITGADPGALFVIRNIANIVPPAGSGDDSVGAAIEYCVIHLGVDDIVICGHSGCGGVKALGEEISEEREGHLKRWVEFARPALERAGIDDFEPARDALKAIQANVLVQRDHLLTYPSVRETFDSGGLRLHCWLFDMESGDLLAYDDESQDWGPLTSRAETQRRRSWLRRMFGAGADTEPTPRGT